MKRLSVAIVATALVASPAASTPYCDALMHESQLERRYQRLAPIFSHTGAGWIFTSDQLDEDFQMKAEADALMEDVIGEFARRDIPLAILVAPPRAVVAGQDIVDLTLGSIGQYNVDDARQSFSDFLTQLRQGGAVVPDLMAVATAESPTPFYFQRDSHWTNTGAARSALALANALGMQATFDLVDIASSEMFQERGSLSDIVDATCGYRAVSEATPQFNYTVLTEQSDSNLLGSTRNTQFALLFGTSFSDRYRRDQYQVADAFSSALGIELINESVSGGGLIGPLEAFALSGGFEVERPDLVIWEFPYTEVPQASALRQLLGAMRANDSALLSQHRLDVIEDSLTLFLDSSVSNSNLLHVRLNTPEARWLKIDLYFPDGQKHTIQLRRKNSMAARGQFEDWWVDIHDVDDGMPEKIRFRFDTSVDVSNVEINFMRYLH
ncbi:alginate O-acetyltransferase AlgX-related protein [Cochlodiniinecator piscidefendens]|uniref:alginate O-acetyltransferase AlgX-related protein n=1 Tax=Cochlodiniinecator piscidefendens TaxID=2715756 RepID=UPI00140A79D8|nr:hypothetical protein [Cochlodiniinecator piscidefendens]